MTTKPIYLHIPKAVLLNIVAKYYYEELQGQSITSVTLASYSDTVSFQLEPSFELDFPTPAKAVEAISTPDENQQPHDSQTTGA